MEVSSRIQDSDFVKAKSLCAQFLRGNWNKKDQIKATTLTGGYVNLIILCQLPEELADSESRPHKVIVRLLTGLNPVLTAGEAGEAIAFDAVAKAGLGPKLLGVFSGGRIEEFTEGSRTLTTGDVRNHEVLTSMAQKVARFHSLSAPIRRRPSVYADKIRSFITNTLEMGKSIDLKDISITSDARRKLDIIMSYDYLSEFEWIMSLVNKFSSRTVLTHGDLYASNVLIKEDRDLVLIDLEMISYFYRGYDIGNFITEATYDFSEPSCPRAVEPLDEGFERHLIREYLSHWKELNPDKFDEDIDNEEYLMREQRIHGLIITILYAMVIVEGVAKNKLQAEGEMVDWIVCRLAIDQDRKFWVQQNC